MMLQPAKAPGAKKNKTKTQTKWFTSGRWLVRFPSLVGTQIFGAHEHRIRQTCITPLVFFFPSHMLGLVNSQVGIQGQKLKGLTRSVGGGLVHITPLRNNPDTHR